MKLAGRMDKLEGSATIAIADKVRNLEAEGRIIIKLSVGEPHLDTPKEAVDATIDALRRGETHYSNSKGLPALRKAILTQHNTLSQHSTTLDPDKHIIVTPGAKQALLYTLLALVEDGDEVIIPTPSWVSYAEMVKLSGATPISVPCAAPRFDVDPEAITAAVNGRTKAIIINTPNNPTGNIISKEKMEKLVTLCKKRNLVLISDEIYDRLGYGQPFTSALGFDSELDNVVLINGFSKVYSMTGWRLGYAIGNKELIRAMTKLQQQSATCPTTFIQAGAIAAIEQGESFIKELSNACSENRDYLISAFRAIPKFTLIPPDGGLYAFIDVSKIEPDDKAFTLDLLDADIAVTPGSAFGPGGEGYIRVCLSLEIEMLKTFMKRMRERYG